MIFRSSFELPVAGLIVSILGLLYCIFISLGIGTEVVCLTSGCQLVNDFKLGWLSPWWIAAFAFACLAGLCVFRLTALAYALATLFLLGDCVFLLIMIFISPCTSCLLAALLVFGTWLALHQRPAWMAKPQRILAGGVSLIWLLLFLLNLGAVFNELAGSQPLATNAEARASVYFSPTCPACREAVRLFEHSATFYAVAENSEDVLIIADLQARLLAGQSLTSGLHEIQTQRESGNYTPPALEFWPELQLRFALLRNQAKISRLGYQSLPVIMFEGLPQSWSNETAKARVETSNQPGEQSAAQPRQTEPTVETDNQPVQEPAETSNQPGQTDQPVESNNPPEQTESFELPPDLQQGVAECGPADPENPADCD